jgi:predicted PhzF superfamily epimerase YddE/YHI9
MYIWRGARHNLNCEFVKSKIFHVNAFCGSSSAGNPGGVCLLEEDRPTEWMQMIGAQMNLSETGFVRQLGDARFALRWFTPTQEMPLCGHVTLAAAHVLWNDVGSTKSPVITFQTVGGDLHASRRAEGIEIALPINICAEIAPPEWLLKALDVTPIHILGGDRKYLIEVESESEVLRAHPNYEYLRRMADRGLILTAASDSPAFDIVSRYFAGYVGVDEDPVTGSAHCCLIPYWSRKLGKRSIRARQASTRGGVLCGYIDDDGNRVCLIGEARTVLSGYLLV